MTPPSSTLAFKAEAYHVAQGSPAPVVILVSLLSSLPTGIKKPDCCLLWSIPLCQGWVSLEGTQPLIF